MKPAVPTFHLPQSCLKKMINRIKNWLQKRKDNKFLDEYKQFAAAVGDAYSYAYLGTPMIYWDGKRLGPKEQINLLDEMEEQYSSMGYRIVPFDRWVGYGGYNQPIDDVWLIKREEGERPQFTKKRDDV